MGHPDRLLGDLTVEQRRGEVGDGGPGGAVLTKTGVRDRAPEGLDHRLEAVAHAEDRHPCRQQRGIQGRRALGIDRRRPT